MKRQVGICSLCGGSVSVPAAWLSVVPAMPTCDVCGATKCKSQSPVIPMENPTVPEMTPEEQGKAWRDWFAASGGAEWDKVDDIEAELGRKEP